MKRYLFGLAVVLAGSSFSGAVADTAGGGGERSPVMLFFDWNSSELSRDSTAALDRAIAALKQGEAGRMVLQGHSDRSGTAADAMILSRRRAEAVRTYLKDRGISDRSLTVEAWGESRPLVETADGVREPQNRRVDIVFEPVR